MKKLNYKLIAKKVIDSEIAALKKLKESFGSSFSRAADVIAKCQGKVVLAGIGKSGLISRKISATLSSVGTSSFYIHPSEAAHGDLGQIAKKDILLIFSYSGETSELKNIINYANRFGIFLIGVASKENSLLLNASNIKIILPRVKESGIGEVVPTSSTTMQLAFGDALAITLMNKKKFNTSKFKQLHPAGSLGKKLTTVEDIMITEKRVPFVNENMGMKKAIEIMNKKKLGCLVVLNKRKNISGFLSDGDVRRRSKKNILSLKLKDIMTKKPITVPRHTLASKAIAIMNKKRITSLIVSNADKNKKNIKVAGLLHIHSILNIGTE